MFRVRDRMGNNHGFFFLQRERLEAELKRDHSLIDLDVKIRADSARHLVWIGTSCYLSQQDYRKSILALSILLK